MLTPEQIESAHTRDGEGFLLAAICNTRLLWVKETRAKLEQFLGRHLRHLYRRRCEEQLAWKAEFDVNPVSEAGSELFEDIPDEKPSAETEQLQALDTRVSQLQQQVRRLQKFASWTLGILALAGLLLLIRRY